MRYRRAGSPFVGRNGQQTAGTGGVGRHDRPDTVSRVVRLGPQFHDGIPLAWWDRYGLSTNSSGAANSDGDAANNAEEYAADTDPTSSSSIYSNRIPSATGPGTTTLQAGPPTTNSRVYDIWFCTNLLQGQWTPMNLNIPGANDGSAISMTVTNTGGLLHYRTSVGVPP